MSFDFIGVEGECWSSNSVLQTSTYGQDTTRLRGGIRLSQAADDPRSYPLPARTAGQITWRMRNNSDWVSGVHNFSWSNDAGIEVLRVRNTNTNTLQLQYWNGSTWVGIGAAQVVTADLVIRAHMVYSGLGTSSGSISLVYINLTSGLPVATWSATGLDLTACTNISRHNLFRTSLGTMSVGEYVSSGNEDLSASVCHTVVGNATGSDNTGATGTFAAFDEGAANQNSVDDADFLQLSSVGSRYSFTAPARDFAGRTVRTLCISYRARRGSSGPQTIRPYIKIGGTRYYAADQVLTTNFTSGYQAFWDVNPATGLMWTAAEAQAASLEFGFEAAA